MGHEELALVDLGFELGSVKQILQPGSIEKIHRSTALVCSMDGSDDLLILETELVTDNLELMLGQSNVNILGEKIHHFSHQGFEVVEPMEGDSCNLQKLVLMGSHSLNLLMEVAQLLMVVETQQGSDDALEEECSDASFDLEAARVNHCQSWSLVYSGQGASEACQEIQQLIGLCF